MEVLKKRLKIPFIYSKILTNKKEARNMTKNRPTLQELNLSDDFLFAKVMENEEVCRRLLEKILDLKIKKVRFVEPQLTKDVVHDAKSVRLDIFLDDEENSVYTVEMQKYNEYNIPKRSRYYHSIVDVEHLLKKGMGYNELRGNYVIFLCLFDFFGYGRHKYSFRHRCEEEPGLELKDEAYTIVLNTRGTADDVDDEMKALLRYIEESTDEVVERSGSDLLALIHSQVKEIKSSRGSEVSYMKFEELLQKEYFEGRSEGELLKLIQLVKKKCLKGKPLGQIAEELEEEAVNLRPIVEKVMEDMERSEEEILEELKGER